MSTRYTREELASCAAPTEPHCIARLVARVLPPDALVGDTLVRIVDRRGGGAIVHIRWQDRTIGAFVRPERAPFTGRQYYVPTMASDITEMREHLFRLREARDAQ